MNHFAFLKLNTTSFLDLPNAIIQIRRRHIWTCAVLNLNNKNWIYISIVLFITILIPMLPLILPFVCSRLKNCHILITIVFFWIRNNNSVLKQARCTYFIRCNNTVLSSRCSSLHKCIKSCRCGRHTYYNRHWSHSIFRTSLKKFLHDCCCSSSVTSLHSSVCFINNDIQTITLISGCIC